MVGVTRKLDSQAVDARGVRLLSGGLPVSRFWVALKVSVAGLWPQSRRPFPDVRISGCLPYSLGAALIVATLLTPPITFILSVTAYLAVGFAIHDLGVSRREH